MERSSAREMSVTEIVKIFRKWKWILLSAGVVILAGTLAFMMLKSKKDFALGIMFPRQIGFSFADKENFNLSARSFNKYDYERMTLFLLNRDLFSQYLREMAGRREAIPDKSYDLQAFIIPNYAVDFGNAAVRNETLQYLLIRSAPDMGLTIDVIGNFTLNVFKNYFLLEIFREYYNSLQTMNFKYLDSQRTMLDGMAKQSAEIAQLRNFTKKYHGSFSGRGNFMLQITGENERYLDLQQQLSANDIQLSDIRISLDLNQKRIARTEFLIKFLYDLRREYLDALYQDPNRIKARLSKMESEFVDKDLALEFNKLKTLFDLVDYNFRLYRGDPMLLKEKHLLFKALAVFIFAFGLLLLAVLMFEYRKNTRT